MRSPLQRRLATTASNPKSEVARGGLAQPLGQKRLRRRLAVSKIRLRFSSTVSAPRFCAIPSAPTSDFGFSVLELTVVALLVATLLCLLLPTFSRLNQKSMSSKCQSHLRNLASAAILSSIDRNGALPDRADWKSTTLAQKSILPYLGMPLRTTTQPASDAASPLTCPAAQSSPFRTDSELQVTYSINQYATGGDSNTTWETQVRDRGTPLRLPNVKNPAQQAFFMDGTMQTDGYGARYSSFQDPSRLTIREDPQEAGWKTPFLHQNAIHVVFLDGHLEPVSRKRAEDELIGAANPSTGQSSPRVHPFWGTEK